MSRLSGKYGKIMLATEIETITNENVGLNSSPMEIDGKTYQARQVGILEHKFVIFDEARYPINLTITSSLTLSYVIDYLRGYIIFSEPLGASDTVTASYSYAKSFLELADMTDWSIDEKVKELDVTAFNDEWEVYIPLQKSWDASITGHFNMLLWNKALGGSGLGGVLTPVDMLYFTFMFNRNATISEKNPILIGQGLLSLSIKTPATSKVEFSGKIKGTLNLAKFVSNPF